MKNPRIIEVIKEGATYLVPTYKVTDNGMEDGRGMYLEFCKGNREDPEVFRQTGVFTESLIQTAIQYLEAVNVGELTSDYTVMTIKKLKEALELIDKRSQDRKDREVQGTYQK